MPNVDLKFTYYRYNRKDGQYDLRAKNPPTKYLFQEDMNYKFRQLIFHLTFLLSCPIVPVL